MPLLRVQNRIGVAYPRVSSGLLAEFLFNEGTGQLVGDNTGNGYGFNFGGSSSVDADDPVWVSGGGIDLAGGKYLTNSSQYLYTGNPSLTIIAVTAVPPLTTQYAALFGAGAGAFNQSLLFARQGSFGPASDKLNLDWYSDPSPAYVAATTAHGSVQSFLAVTYENSSRFTEFFQNATSLGSGTKPNGNPNIPASGVQYIGRSGHLSTEFWYSVVHYMAFYNRVLTGPELTQMRDYCRALVAPRGVTLP